MSKIVCTLFDEDYEQALSGEMDVLNLHDSALTRNLSISVVDDCGTSSSMCIPLFALQRIVSTLLVADVDRRESSIVVPEKPKLIIN
jgi:hypothetical protein